MKPEFAYRWVDFRNCYEIYHIKTGKNIHYTESVDEARTYTESLNKPNPPKK